TNNQFSPDEHDIGITFTLTATGRSSGITAATTFTDATVDTVSITVRASDCITAKTTFVQGETACVHFTVTVKSGGDTDSRLQIYTPGALAGNQIPIRDTFKQNIAAGTYDYDESLALATNAPAGTWTALVCKTNNAGNCSSGNQAGNTNFT